MTRLPCGGCDQWCPFLGTEHHMQCNVEVQKCSSHHSTSQPATPGVRHCHALWVALHHNLSRRVSHSSSIYFLLSVHYSACCADRDRGRKACHQQVARCQTLCRACCMTCCYTQSCGLSERTAATFSTRLSQRSVAPA